MKLLFILKTNQNSGGSDAQVSKSGLYNAARFIVEHINDFPNVRASLVQIKDQNGVFQVIAQHAPDVVIIEAVWILPSKLHELVDKFPHTRFITRVHSRIPFIAMEGNVVEWIRKYEQFSELAFNNKQTADDMRLVGIPNLYLPNIYPDVRYMTCEPSRKKHHYKIGCFGSVRPFKNQLAQAWAAIRFADKRNATVHFHINGTGAEQQGDSVIKNLRALFAGTRHKLIEVPWLDHREFIKLIGQMDACMQVSMTETFNLVTADAVLAHVPVVVSDEIDWLSCRKARFSDVSDIAEVLAHVIDHKHEQVQDNIHDLELYDKKSILHWFRFSERD